MWRSCLIHFNVRSCGIYRFQPRRPGGRNCFLSGLDRAPIYRGFQMFAHYWTHWCGRFPRSAVPSKVGAAVADISRRRYERQNSQRWDDNLELDSKEEQEMSKSKTPLISRREVL